MTKEVGTASASCEIKHTQDLIAAIASGIIRPGKIPSNFDKPSIRTLVEAMYNNPHKSIHEPYTAQIAAGNVVKFTIVANANGGIAPPITQLPGPERLVKWIERVKIHTEKCRALGCSERVVIIEVKVGGKIGFLSIEDGQIRLDPPTLTEDDFLPTKRSAQGFDPTTIFGRPKPRIHHN